MHTYLYLTSVFDYRCIVQAVCQDSLQSIKRRKTFIPPLIVSQQKIVILICTLQEENSMYKNLIDSILILIENFISTLINCSLEVSIPKESTSVIII